MSQAALPRLKQDAAPPAERERLGWTSGFTFESYGVLIGVRTNDAAVMSRLRELLPPGATLTKDLEVDHLCSVWVAERPGQAAHQLYADAEPAVEATELEVILAQFESQAHLWVAEHARERIFVHAGVVAHNGRALVLPGKSFAGKTTLVRTLLSEGALYYSDEAAVFDGEGRVHPYARPLAVREVPGELSRRRPASEFGARVGTEPLPVGAVVVSTYQPEAEWRPKRLTPGTALLELLANTVPAQGRPEMVFATLSRVVAEAPAYKGTRGEASLVAKKFLRYLEM